MTENIRETTRRTSSLSYKMKKKKEKKDKKRKLTREIYGISFFVGPTDILLFSVNDEQKTQREISFVSLYVLSVGKRK